jgi:hypothetical protein
MDYTRPERQIMDNLKVWQWGNYAWHWRIDRDHLEIRRRLHQQFERGKQLYDIQVWRQFDHSWIRWILRNNLDFRQWIQNQR